jgi:hypothetical protein
MITNEVTATFQLKKGASVDGKELRHEITRSFQSAGWTPGFLKGSTPEFTATKEGITPSENLFAFVHNAFPDDDKQTLYGVIIIFKPDDSQIGFHYAMESWNHPPPNRRPFPLP